MRLTVDSGVRVFVPDFVAGADFEGVFDAVWLFVAVLDLRGWSVGTSGPGEDTYEAFVAAARRLAP